MPGDVFPALSIVSFTWNWIWRKERAMRRKLFTIIIVSAVFAAPATSRANGCCFGWAGFAAAMTFGFLVPATIAAVSAANAPAPPPYPYPYPVYYEAPPRQAPPPANPAPARLAERPA